MLVSLQGGYGQEPDHNQMLHQDHRLRRRLRHGWQNDGDRPQRQRAGTFQL